MPAMSLQELFVEELRDMYDGEKRLVRALPKMAKAAGSSELRTAFMTHAKETERQVSRLERVFRTIGETARGKKCEGIIGIVEEGNEAMQELDGAVLDAALIAGAQKVEHYEISSYGTLAYFAELLGENEAKDLLGETLDEEKAADEKLSDIAKSDVNRNALLGSDDQERSSRGGVMGTVRRAAASMGLANERTGRRRSTARGSSTRRNSRTKRARR
jgi:ferritin-like metal-binding protein YciE